jgi:hypothetical protein
MRAIKFCQVAVFLWLLLVILVLAIGTTLLVVDRLPLGDFRGVTLVLAAVLLIYLYAFLVYRLFLLALPLPEGEVPEHSRHELVANVNSLFYLLLFNSLICTHFIPVPIQRLIYLALGARLGVNTAGRQHLQRRRPARSAADTHRQQYHHRPRGRHLRPRGGRRAAGTAAGPDRQHRHRRRQGSGDGWRADRRQRHRLDRRRGHQEYPHRRRRNLGRHPGAQAQICTRRGLTDFFTPAALNASSTRASN